MVVVGMGADQHVNPSALGESLDLGVVLAGDASIDHHALSAATKRERVSAADGLGEEDRIGHRSSVVRMADSATSLQGGSGLGRRSPSNVG